MQRLIFSVILRIIILNVIIMKTYSFRATLYMHPPVPGLPPNTDRPSKTTTKSTPALKPTSTIKPQKGPYLLDNYLPPVMQALAYYIELLQYETTHMTTIEPPLNAEEVQSGTTYKPPPSTTPPADFTSTIKTTTTTKKPWWQPATTTQRPSSTTTITWWKPPSTTTTTVTTSTKKPTTIWWKPSSTTTTNSFISSTAPTTQWWQTTKPSSHPPCTTTASHDSTTKKPSTIWWLPSTITSTLKPTTSQTTQWWQQLQTTTSKPWWQYTTTKSSTTSTLSDVISHTTPSHKPGLFAPRPPNMKPSSFASSASAPSSLSSISSTIVHNHIDSTFSSQESTIKPQNFDEVTSSLPTSDKNFIEWLFQPKAKVLKPDTEYDFQLLDPLPGSLIQDILNERYQPPAIMESDNIREFLRIYDDSFGRYQSITGKKKVPITKPYVEFLILYDLLKREAKAMNLNKYEGYTVKMLQELAETSTRSAERQLHILMTRLLVRGDVERKDVINRIKSIIKDLENPESTTSKALRYIPPLQFVM